MDKIPQYDTIMTSARSMWNSHRMLEDIAWYPNEQIVRFIVKYLKKRTGLHSWRVKRDVHTVLDLGCGTGRHVKLFADQGFKVHGVDISAKCVQFAREWMHSLELSAHLVVGSAFELPYRSQMFDVVVSHGVVDHMAFGEARETVKEVHRVLRPNGLFYLDLINKDDSSFGEGLEIETDTFIVPDGIEAGTIQRFYDEASIKALLNDKFVFEDIVFQAWYPIWGTGFSNLDKTTSFSAKLARFHVVSSPRSEGWAG